MKKAMTQASRKTARPTKRKKLEFTRAHEILLAGLIGSGMNYPNIFKLEMAIKSEADALRLAVWMRDRLDETGKFPTPEEIMQQAKVKPYR